jgi:hypothetical protein
VNGALVLDGLDVPARGLRGALTAKGTNLGDARVDCRKTATVLVRETYSRLGFLAILVWGSQGDRLG